MGRPRKNSLPAHKKEQETTVIENSVINIDDVKIIDDAVIDIIEKDDDIISNPGEIIQVFEKTVVQVDEFPAFFSIENKTNGQIVIPFLGVNLSPSQSVIKEVKDSRKHFRLVGMCRQLADIYGGEILVTRA